VGDGGPDFLDRASSRAPDDGHPSEARQVARGRIRIFLECFFVFLDGLKRMAGRPPAKRADLEILV
jgi:hypothetical protein